MNQLIRLKKTDGSVLRVVDWITSLNDHECEDFAHMLLKNDSLVGRYLTECGGDNNKFIRAVLRDWLSRDDDDDDAVPRTWGDLATCVEDSGLPEALVKAIREFISLGKFGRSTCGFTTPQFYCAYIICMAVTVMEAIFVKLCFCTLRLA